MAIKNALRIRSKQKFASAALQTLYSDYVEQGKIYCFQQIVWEIDKLLANGNTRVRLYIDGHGYKHFLDGLKPVNNNTLYIYDKQVWLIPGERLALELDQAQADTTAEMNMTGYSMELKEGIQ